MHITVVCVGRIKEKYFTAGIEEYAKRLGRYCRLEIVEVAEEKAPETLSDREMVQVKEREGERLLARLRETDTVVALAIEGKQMSSEELAAWMDRCALTGRPDLAFVIGGSLGLSEAVLKRADLQLSFSRMTFPHQLMRVILLEQVYRGFRILKNEPYHK